MLSQLSLVTLALMVGVLGMAAAPASAACVPPPPGLVSWWPGDGNAKDIADGNDGTPLNGASFAPGLVGQAFAFDGFNARVDVASSLNLMAFPNGLTIDAWVNPSRPPGQFLGGIVTKWAQSVSGDAYAIWLTNSLQLFGGIGTGVSDSGFPGGFVPVDQWSHVAMTYDSLTGDNRLYVNGLLVAQRSWFPGGPNASGVEPVQIGNQTTNESRPFAGLVDEVEIFNRVLSASEIQAIVAAGSAGKCKNQQTSTPGKVTGGGFIQPDGTMTPATLLIQSGINASVGDKATFGFGVQFAAGDSNPTGNLQYDDHAANVTITAVSFTLLNIGGGVCGPNTHAKIRGSATVTGPSGPSTQDFEVEVDDCGGPSSVPPDTFKITTTGPTSYMAMGPILGGNITIHKQ